MATKTAYQFPDTVIFKDGELDDDSTSRLVSYNTEAGINLVPGSATFTFRLQTEGREGKNEINQFINARNECTLWQSMDEIEVWGSGDVVGNRKSYYPIFWGVVTLPMVNYGGGEITVTVNCLDVLHWLQITRVNTRFDIAADVSKREEYLKSLFFTQKFADKSVKELFVKIILSATVDELFVSDFSFKDVYGKDLTAEFASITGTAKYKKEQAQKRAAELRQKLAESIKAGESQNGVFGSAQARATIERNRQDIGGYWSTQALGKLNKRLRLMDDGAAEDLMPFQLDMSNPNIDFYKGEYISRLALAQDIANAINYEFFMNPAGEIVLKPPGYNMPAVNAIYPEEVSTDTVAQIDLNAMLTRVDVFGKAHHIKALGEGLDPIVHNSYTVLKPNTMFLPAGEEVIDFERGEQVNRDKKWDDMAYNYGDSRGRYDVKRYGVRSANVENPLLRTIDECAAYGRFYLDRHNADVTRVTFNLDTFRPDIQLGFPILDYRNLTIWYVKRIRHTFNPESKKATTSIDCNARRLPLWITEDGQLIVSVVAPSRKTYFFGWEPYGSLITINVSSGSEGARKSGFRFLYGTALNDGTIEEVIANMKNKTVGTDDGGTVQLTDKANQEPTGHTVYAEPKPESKLSEQQQSLLNNRSTSLQK